MTPTLRIEGLHLEIATPQLTLPVLRDVNLTVAPGEVHGLVGESGAGKSMVARAILGILPRNAVISAGAVSFQERNVLSLAPQARRALLGRSIALIPQDPLTALNPSRRIGGQLKDYLKRRLHLPGPEIRSRSIDLLMMVAICGNTGTVRYCM